MYIQTLKFQPSFQKTHRSLLKKLQKTKKFLQATLQKERKNIFNKINTSFVSGNKLFWKFITRFFSNKAIYQGNIKLIEGHKLLQEDTEDAEKLDNFFKEAVSTSHINENSYITIPDSIDISDHVGKAISKYKFHASMLLLNDKIINQVKLPFKPIPKLDIEK